MAKGGSGRKPRNHPHGWSSDPGMWRNPKSVNAKKGSGSAPAGMVIAAAAGFGTMALGIVGSVGYIIFG